jgi:hypothetical protein
VSGDIVLYGLCIRSDVPLHQGRSAEPGRAPDVEIVVGADMALCLERPAGELIAEDDFSETEWYRFVRLPSGDYHLRYASACDFVVSSDLHQVVVHPVRGVDPDRITVFASGGLPAFLLMMRGDLVLHASAVAVDGRVVAFAGASGMGKSTMATLCCSQGAHLVTDDVLRLDTEADPPRCYLGANELRLRRSSADLAARFETQPHLRHTGDGREALTPRAATSERLPLAALVIPIPDRTAGSLSLTRLEPMKALMALLALPRLPGWEDSQSHAVQMEHLGGLVERVDVYIGRIPWGPPFPGDLLRSLLEAAGVGQSGRSA